MKVIQTIERMCDFNHSTYDEPMKFHLNSKLFRVAWLACVVCVFEHD